MEVGQASTVRGVTDLRRTPLFDRHVASGAKTADFGGWEMPIEYAGVVAEHTAVRSAAGLFDVSHMGKVYVTGPGAIAYLDSILTNDLGRIGAGRAQYSMLLNAEGGVVDDLIVYRWSDDSAFVVPNAANAAGVVAALRVGCPDTIAVTDRHEDFGILAVQGPTSTAVLEQVGLPCDVEYMAMARSTYGDADVVVCRTGYTGERGYEIVAPVEVLGGLWDDLIDRGSAVGLQPAGLGARDTLRTEMGYPLHGQDIGPMVSPVEAGLGWAVGWDKELFHGADAARALRADGPTRRLRGLRAIDRGIPRPHMTVHRDVTDGSDPLHAPVVGEVTSGTFSPTLRVGIALALLSTDIAAGDTVVLDIRGRPTRFEVCAPPFVDADPRR